MITITINGVVQEQAIAFYTNLLKDGNLIVLYPLSK